MRRQLQVAQGDIPGKLREGRIVAQVLARLQTISDVLDARKVSDRDALDAVCDQRIDQDRRERRCQRINDRAPSDAMYLHQLFPNSTSKINQ